VIIRKPQPIPASEITPRDIYERRRQLRRQFLKVGSGIAAAGIAGPLLAKPAAQKLPGIRKTAYGDGEKLTAYEYVTGYNNFYEFGTAKDDPAQHAGSLKTRPWSVAIDGEVEKPATYRLDDLIRPHALEERIYRLRCVEAWSMVVPWVGIPLASIIRRVRPTSKAKFVQFVTLHDPKQMPGQRPSLFGSGLDWPYVEGLRIDEAMHPLTLLAVGVYGEVLPNQNGAPVRLVVPWKYGFKSIKSIVKIRFVERQPATTWHLAAPREYGFYSNVNPRVDHPRWSQARERRIGEDGLFTAKRETLMFNGYADDVAHLYRGMDLKKFY
jgi:sulfoxide reductase catalytic subunit YedY